jgi:hypothetical protein
VPSCASNAIGSSTAKHHPCAGETRSPRKDGDQFQGSRPETWGEPDASWQGTDQRGKPIQVQAWQHLHFRQAREVEVTVYRVLRTGAKGTRRDPQESWFVWIGVVPLPLEEVVSCYQRRFSHEHTYRFLKQDLLWTKVHVRTAQQFEHWSVVVATAMNQLVLARSLGQANYRPWERRRHLVTPRQVRRVMPALLQQLGTPTCVPKPRGKSHELRNEVVEELTPDLVGESRAERKVELMRDGRNKGMEGEKGRR